MIVVRVVSFAGWYTLELVHSYVRMVADIVGVRGVTPCLVRIDTHCVRETEIGLLGILISLAPGTIVVDSRAHRPEGAGDTPWTLYVHGIHESDPERLRATLADLEHRLLEALGRTDLPTRPGRGTP